MKKYWKSPDEFKFGVEKEQDPEIENNHKNAVLDLLENTNSRSATSRRDFLRLWGYSLTAATLVSSCEKPVQKTIPYLIKPEEITPGKAVYYASSFFDGSEYASILVKTRDGRPIKIEGNDASSISRGKISARVQASVLSLYDEARFRHPLLNGGGISWDDLDTEIMDRLSRIRNQNGKLVLLTGTIISPSTRSVIQEFIETMPGMKWIQYDPVSHSAMLQANEKSFGLRGIPNYHFENAELIVNFGADFLGTWIAPVYFTRGYIKNRTLNPGKRTMSKHIQFETGLSVTGSNADYRHPIKPSDEWTILANIFNLLARDHGLKPLEAGSCPVSIEDVVDDLRKNKGKSIILSGSNDISTQLLVNRLNMMLNNYGTTIDLTRPLQLRQGIDLEMQDFVEDMNAGLIAGVFFYNANPAYNFPDQDAFNAGLEKVGLKVSFACSPDETAALSEFICPDHHYLESWNDAEPVKNSYSLSQPTIHPVYKTRQFQDSLLKWMGKNSTFYQYIRENWERELFPMQNVNENFDQFWTRALQDGVFEIAENPIKLSAEWLAGEIIKPTDTADQTGIQMTLYEKVGIGDGGGANNPWLQELPDPISKACWDNYVCISPKMADELELQNEDVVFIDGLELPVFIQPGQAAGTLSIALGYGRSKTGKVADNAGVNVYPFTQWRDFTRQLSVENMTIEKTGKKHDLALTQTHYSMEGREIVRETTFDSYLHTLDHPELHEENGHHQVTLYKEPHFDGHHWGMAINLSACTGCGACILACQAENNIPVVGKEEVKKRRILHWLRLDRYYSDDPEDPSVFQQPVMCMHCDNAPCENVCPVSATMHSNEGLNQVAYNRCIGTKYCINNCPYRVRRFNWFKYANNDDFDFHQNSDIGKLVLNPDVTVRGRGVVEKCSFCVQRIQDKKLDAKLEARPLNDGEIQPACVQTCPSDALVFGDLNDPESKVSRLFKDQRNYFLLDQLHTLPSVGYLAKIRNRREDQEKGNTHTENN